MSEVMKINRSRNLKQSQRLVTARYRLTNYEQRMMIAICSQIESDADEFKPVRVKVADIAEFCGINGNDKYKRIHQTLIKLMSRSLQLQNEDGNWYVTHWLQSAEYLGNGLIEYCLDQRLKPDLLQLKSTYFSTPAAPLMKFKREYTARFYFIFQKGPKGQAFDLELDFIREIFQLGETYRQFSNIKDRVIEPSIKELNEKSDLQVFHQYIKTGRVFTVLRFVVTSKNTEIVTISHKTDTAEITPPLEPQTVESEEAASPAKVAAPEPQLPPTKSAPPAPATVAKPATPAPKPTAAAPVNATPAPKSPPATATPAPKSAAPMPSMPASKTDAPAPKPTASAAANVVIATPKATPPQTAKNAPETAKKIGATQNTQKAILPPQNENTAVYGPIVSEASQLAAQMMDKSRWKLSPNMALKLLKRYGSARVKANLIHAEQHAHPKYSGGQWLIHSIVTNAAEKK